MNLNSHGPLQRPRGVSNQDTPSNELMQQWGASGFTGCILAAPALHPVEAMKHLMPLLAPSAPFVIFSGSLQVRAVAPQGTAAAPLQGKYNLNLQRGIHIKRVGAPQANRDHRKGSQDLAVGKSLACGSCCPSAQGPSRVTATWTNREQGRAEKLVLGWPPRKLCYPCVGQCL